MGKVPIFRTPLEQKNTVRLVVGTSTAGWTAADCDYLCDGTDDQVEINAAMKALPSTGGEVVVLGGIYNCSNQIIISRAHTVLSGGGDATVLRLVNKSSHFIYIGCDHATVQSLMVDGNKLNIESNSHVIIVNGYSNCAIKSVTIRNAKGSGIIINSSSSCCTVEGCLIDSANRGIYVNAQSSNSTIANNVCVECSKGIDCSSTTINNIVTNNLIYRCNHGIIAYGSSRDTIIGNRLVNNTDAAISLGPSSSACTVSGNICKDNAIGISVQGTNHTITGNTCIRGKGTSSDYTSSQHTIEVSGSSTTGNLIANNNIMGKNYTNSGGSGNTFTNNKYQ